MCDVCTSRDVHFELYAYLLTRHADACREQLIPLLLRKEARIGEARRANLHLDAEVTRLTALRDAKTAHLAALRARLGTPTPLPPASSRLAVEYEKALADLAAMRSSWSWRVTAPIRAVYDLVAPRRGRAT
jgi:hypothetical protein